MSDPNVEQVDTEDLLDNHEKYVGGVIEDPWADPTQTDWGNADPVLDADEDADDDCEVEPGADEDHEEVVA